MTQAEDTSDAVQRVVAFYEALTPSALGNLAQLYTDDARFKDPFNEVQGLPAIRGVFEHMFTSLHEPRFVVTERVTQGAQCVLMWEFHFRFKRYDTQTLQVVRGASHLRLAPDGRIADHRDYWDAAEELYERLPLLGALMRWLKRRARE